MALERIVSAVLFLALVAWVVWLGALWMSVMLVVLWVTALYEWWRMANASFSERGILMGILILSLSFACVALLVFCAPPFYVVWLLSLVVIFDSFCWLGGRWLGMTPLMARVSPHKTWEGLSCGIAAVLLMSSLWGMDDVMMAQLPVLLMACVGGDALESWAKRVAHVKDSGTWMRGHGGLLDRMDAMLMVAVTASVMMAGQGRLACGV